MNKGNDTRDLLTQTDAVDHVIFAEKALQLEKDKQQAVFSSMKDGVYIVNTEYDLEFVNKALTDDFGQYKTARWSAGLMRNLSKTIHPTASTTVC